MRATGLKFLSQRFDVGGVRVDVRIEGEHSFVSIGGKLGKYLCLPHSTAHPDGVLTAGTPPSPVPPTAILKLSSTGGAPKLDEHVEVHTGRNDWRGGGKGTPRIITFDTSHQRYSYAGEPLEQPGIYDNGVTIPTRITLPGMGEVNCGVLGACVVSGVGRSFYVMATTARAAAPLRRTIYICYRTEGEWELIDSIDVPEHWDAYSPVIFSPDGSKFNTILRHGAPPSVNELPARKVSGTLVMQSIGDVVTVVSSHTVDDIPGTSISVEVIPDPGTPYTVYNVQHSQYTVKTWRYERGVTVLRTRETTGWSMVRGGGHAEYGQRRRYTYPIAYDYDEQSNEIPVTLRSDVHERHAYDDEHVGYYPGSWEPDTSGDYSIYSSSGVENDYGLLLKYEEKFPGTTTSSWALGLHAETHSDVQYTDERRDSISIYFGDKNVATTTWVHETSSSRGGDRYEQNIYPWVSWDHPGRIEYWSGTATRVYGTAQYLALDARTDAVLMVEITSSVENLSLPRESSRGVKVTMKFGEHTKEYSWSYPQGIPIFPEGPYSPTGHGRVELDIAKGNYASRDGKTFVFSASPDDVGLVSKDVDGSSSLPEIGEAVTWISGYSGPAEKLFELGPEPGFAINPITIF